MKKEWASKLEKYQQYRSNMNKIIRHYMPDSPLPVTETEALNLIRRIIENEKFNHFISTGDITLTDQQVVDLILLNLP